jgi:hypothetical protein
LLSSWQVQPVEESHWHACSIWISSRHQLYLEVQAKAQEAVAEGHKHEREKTPISMGNGLTLTQILGATGVA